MGRSSAKQHLPKGRAQEFLQKATEEREGPDENWLSESLMN